MKVFKSNINRNKSQNKKLLNKNIATNKSTNFSNKINPRKTKSKDKKINSVGNSIRLKSKTKQNNINSKNEIIKPNLNNYNDYNIYDNYNEHYNNNQLNYENKKVNNDLSMGDSLNFNFINSNKNSKICLNDLCNKQYINNEYIESSNIFKKTLDRLLMTSTNLLEKQNNILNECDILSKNVAMNDYAIQNINNNENKFNFKNNIDNYTHDITTILSNLKKTNTNSQINEELKKENNLLKNKLEMLTIDTEDNIKLKDGEINTLKIVLVSEINHIINFLNEIGYNNIPINKMEISDLTSQKLTNFFELIIKIIKQMKELILKKESTISKMTIEQNTLRDNKNENINNKSFEKLSLDYNNYNIGLKNYNISVQNSNQKKKFNISFRNYGSTRNINKDFDNISKNNNITEKNNININNNNELKNNINDNEKNNYKDNNYEFISDKDVNKKEENDNNNNNNNIYNNKLEEQLNMDIKMNSNSYFYNKERQGDNYSYDIENINNNNNYQTGSFNLKQNNINKKEEDDIIQTNIKNDFLD